MSDIDIIDTDDEIIYTEDDIRELCQREEDLLDVDKIILKREKKERRKLYQSEDIIDVIKDIEIGKEILDHYRLALEKNTPVELVFKNNKGDYFSIRDRLTETKDIFEELKFFKNEYSLDKDDFVLAYYFSNNYKDDKYIVNNLNIIRKITGVEYRLDEWPEKRKRFNTVFDNRMDKTLKDFKRLEKFYGEINDLPFSTTPDNIKDSFNLDKTKVIVKVRKEDSYFDIDTGAIIFEELSVNKNFPYIQYNSYDDKFYKIFDKNTDLNRLLNEKKEIFENMDDEESEKNNRIYIIYKLDVYGKTYFLLLEFNLEDSSLTFEYPSKFSYKIYEDLKKLIPGLVIKEEKPLSVNGSFNLKIDNYSELNFYYLTLFDEKFSNFIYVNESKRPRSLMKNIKYYYKNYESDFSVTFYLEKLNINSYLVKFKSKVEKNNSISEFSLILSKLISYYENYDFLETDLPIILNPYTGKDGDGLGDNLKVDDINLDNKAIKGNKLTNLLSIAPGVFPVSDYSKKCSCPNQPIIIDEEDIGDWKNYLDKDAVSVFPPIKSIDKDKKKYVFACPTDGLVFNYIINPDSKSPFPILPCCSQTIKNSYYEDYDTIKNDPETYFNLKEDQKVNITKGIKKTLNPLANNQKGNIPLVLKQFLNNIYPQREFFRYGLNKNSKSSFFHCCIEASDHLPLVSKKIKNKKHIRNLKFLNDIYLKYNSLDVTEKDKLVDLLKNRIGNEQGIKINLEITYQELYNFDRDTINYLLEEDVFDSKYFYKLMEYLYFLNIFVFVFKDGNLRLEKPNHQHYHQREYRFGLPCLLLIKHMDGQTPIYEIIKTEDTSLLDDKFLSYMKNYIENSGYYINTYCEEEGYKITKNTYSDVNINIIFKNYLITGQFINDSGRSYALNVDYGEGTLTVFIPSSFPVDAPKAYKVYKASKETAHKLFGKKYLIGSEGFWYPFNNLEKGVFIPIEGVKNKDYDKCYPYIIAVKRSRGVNKFNKINTIKKNSKIIMQIILHVWNLSKEEDLDSWFKYYISKGDKKTINTVCNNNILIDYRFPKHLKTPEEVIYYYSDYIPSIFGKDVIFLYDELELAVYRYLQNYIDKTSGYTKENLKNSAIVEIFNSESDFTQRLNNKLVVSEKNYDDWENFIQSESKDFINLDSNLNTKKRGFLYKNKEGNIFIIQNNLENSLKTSILTAKVWKNLNHNLGYYVTTLNIWKYIINDYRILEALEIDSQEIINLANKHSKFNDLEIKELYEALDYLYREKVEYELKQEDYNYITLNYMEYINKENLKANDPYNLFSYENEAYAAMLNIV